MADGDALEHSSEAADEAFDDERAGARVLRFPMPERRFEPEQQPRLREVIGEVLREERHRQARTLADVADGAAVSLPYLSEVERGRKEVSSDVLAAIADELALPLADVLERSARRLRPEARCGGTFTLLAA